MRKLLGALLAIMLLALPALGSGGPNLKVTTDCSEAGYFITVTNEGKKDATFFIAVGDGYIEWTLAPGDSKEWKASTGESWVVWVGDGDIIAEGEHETCNSTTTTTTTAPDICYECADPTSTTIPTDTTVPDTTDPESTTTTEPIEGSATTVAPSTTTSTVPPPTSTTAPAASTHIGPSDTLPFTGLLPASVDPMILVVGGSALILLGLILLAAREFSDDEEEL